MSKNQISTFPLRLPPELRQWLKDTADKNRRAMNSEVLIILEAERQRQRASRRQTTEGCRHD